MSTGNVASFLYGCGKFGESDTLADPDDLKDTHKLLILHGGEDISPSIYGELPRATNASASPSVRDTLEIEVLKRAIHLGVPVLAICRGAQLACSVLGGSLYQDVRGHGSGDHPLVLTDSNKTILTNSCHHQMMRPVNGLVLANAGKRTAKRFKINEYVVEEIDEPEVIYWPGEKILGVQGHPEWNFSAGAVSIYNYTRKLMHQYFGV